VAAVDAKHQVIVGAEAFGSANEAEILTPMAEQVRATFRALGRGHIQEGQGHSRQRLSHRRQHEGA
jgi:hypothetical protein